MSGQVYTVHLWPPLRHARHYSGSTRRAVPARLTDHALGRGARMLQVQMERGGTWILGEVRPGGRIEERRIKNQHQGAKHCDVCKSVKAYEAGKATAEDALQRAGWDRLPESGRSVLLEIFGLDAAPQGMASLPVLPVETPRVELKNPEVTEVTPELAELADGLIAQWTAEKKAPEPETEIEAG